MINWDVVWSMLRTLLVAGGPVATLLLALGFPPVQVTTWLGIGLAIVGIATVVVPGLIGALKQTDQGKAKTIDHLDPAGKAAVLEKLPDETKIAAAAALPDVTKITIAPTASDGVAAVAADPSQPKIVKETKTP